MQNIKSINFDSTCIRFDIFDGKSYGVLLHIVKRYKINNALKLYNDKRQRCKKTSNRRFLSSVYKINRQKSFVSVNTRQKVVNTRYVVKRDKLANRKVFP